MMDKSKYLRRILVLFMLLLMISCEEEREPPYYGSEEKFHLSMFSGVIGWSSDLMEKGPQDHILIRSDSLYPCYNWTIDVSQDNSEDGIMLSLEGLIIPEICLTAIGPSKYSGTLELNSEAFTIEVFNGYSTALIELSVSDTLISVTNDDLTFLSIDESFIWRHRPNTFVYSCGTMDETRWIFEDFRDSILTIGGIEQFYFADYGVIPYPRTSGGYYVDHLCLYFKYADITQWEEVKAKLIDFSSTILPPYSGVGVFVTNHEGDAILSWLYD